MFLAIVAAALQTIPVVEPVLPAGISPELSSAVQKVASLTEAKDFGAAKAALKLLPDVTVKLEWDDSAVPKSSRYDFQVQRDDALRQWNNALTTQSTIVPSGGDIRAKFVDGSGVSLKWSDDPSEPRLTINIGLKQDNGPVDPVRVYNELTYALGSYRGIGKVPLAGYLMAGVENATERGGPLPFELFIAKANMRLCSQIRDSVKSSTAIKIAKPALGDNPAPLDLGRVVQGTPVKFTIPVKNSGQGTMAFQVVPDCSCFSVHRMQTVKPGESTNAEVSMSTSEYTGIFQGGALHHKIYLFTNEGEGACHEIPVEIKITPRYRMVPDRQLLVAEGSSATFEAYLFFPPDHPMTVTSADSKGLPGEVSFEPWQGELADPDVHEGPLPRKGYKFTLKLKDIPQGSQMGTNIEIATDDAQFPVITCTLFVQRGILALPPSVFMGEVGAAPRKLSFYLGRKGKTFKITSVETDSSNLKASFETLPDPGEYRVNVSYDGKAIPGDFHGTVIVKTDDPKQKEIDVPVVGTIRSSGALVVRRGAVG